MEGEGDSGRREIRSLRTAEGTRRKITYKYKENETGNSERGIKEEYSKKNDGMGGERKRKEYKEKTREGERQRRKGDREAGGREAKEEGKMGIGRWGCGQG